MKKTKKMPRNEAAEPIFGEQSPSEDPTKYKLHHVSDSQHYKDMIKQVQPIPKPADSSNLVFPLENV